MEVRQVRQVISWKIAADFLVPLFCGHGPGWSPCGSGACCVRL